MAKSKKRSHRKPQEQEQEIQRPEPEQEELILSGLEPEEQEGQELEEAEEVTMPLEVEEVQERPKPVFGIDSIKDVDEMGKEIKADYKPKIIFPTKEQVVAISKVHIPVAVKQPLEPPQKQKVHCSNLSSCTRKVYKVKDRGNPVPHTVEMALPDGKVYVVEFRNGEAMIPQNVAEYLQKNLSKTFMVI